MPDVRQVQVTFDCADPAALAAFWREVLGYAEEPPPAGHDSWEAALEALGVPREEWNSRSACSDPNGVGPRLFFQRVPEPKAAKNRVHLDVRSAPDLRGEDRMAALEAEAERLTALGATRIRRYEPAAPLDAGHIVLQDPEGNEFCLD
jgi:catechol 2,3-dioxygenase-like lactoylglutathione lyase family enzyme